MSASDHPGFVKIIKAVGRDAELQGLLLRAESALRFVEDPAISEAFRIWQEVMRDPANAARLERVNELIHPKNWKSQLQARIEAGIAAAEEMAKRRAAAPPNDEPRSE